MDIRLSGHGYRIRKISFPFEYWKWLPKFRIRTFYKAKRLVPSIPTEFIWDDECPF